MKICKKCRQKRSSSHVNVLSRRDKMYKNKQIEWQGWRKEIKFWIHYIIWKLK